MRHESQKPFSREILMLPTTAHGSDPYDMTPLIVVNEALIRVIEKCNSNQLIAFACVFNDTKSNG